jgi:hypothetical protein
MRIPRKNSDTLIVLGGKSGAFWFGFWCALGVISAAMVALAGWSWGRRIGDALAVWWGA